MEFTVKAHGFKFNVQADGFIASNAREDAERAVDLFETALLDLPAAEVAALHAGSRQSAETGEIASQEAFDKIGRLADKAKDEACADWFNKNAPMLMVSPATAVFCVHATNKFFWQTLAVRAESIEAAETAFLAYLADSKSEEAYELKQAVESGMEYAEDAEELDPASYVYKFSLDHITEIPLGSKWRKRNIGETVEMLDSGGNG